MKNADRLARAVQEFGYYEQVEDPEIAKTLALNFMDKHAEFLIGQAEVVRELLSRIRHTEWGNQQLYKGLKKEGRNNE